MLSSVESMRPVSAGSADALVCIEREAKFR